MHLPGPETYFLSPAEVEAVHRGTMDAAELERLVLEHGEDLAVRRGMASESLLCYAARCSPAPLFIVVALRLLWDHVDFFELCHVLDFAIVGRMHEVIYALVELGARPMRSHVQLALKHGEVGLAEYMECHGGT